jgi:outer membrane protein OmpA-like peptidoglycan-associated protein
MRVTGLIAAGFVLLAGAGCAHKAPPAALAASPRPASSAANPALPSARQVPASSAATAPGASGGQVIYFSLDDALIHDDAGPVLQDLARRLAADPARRVRIEGNCDERGTT